MNSYYDFDIDVEELVSRSALDDYFYLQDIKSRKFYLNGEINQFSVADIVRHILQYNSEDRGVPVEERKPILLYISSVGGEVDSGYELIDAIEMSLTPVYTVVLGSAYSMAFLISLAGHKRYAMPNAKYLMHDGYNGASGSTMKVYDTMEFQKRAEERTKEYIIAHSQLTPEEYDAKLRVEWYMFADEALEKGFVDYIVDKADVFINEVV